MQFKVLVLASNKTIQTLTYVSVVSCLLYRRTPSHFNFKRINASKILQKNRDAAADRTEALTCLPHIVAEII